MDGWMDGCNPILSFGFENERMRNPMQKHYNYVRTQIDLNRVIFLFECDVKHSESTDMNQPSCLHLRSANNSTLTLNYWKQPKQTVKSERTHIHTHSFQSNQSNFFRWWIVKCDDSWQLWSLTEDPKPLKNWTWNMASIPKRNQIFYW